MKRQNYYQVHKNKKPKKLQCKKYDLRFSKVAVLMAKHTLTISIIEACKNMSITSKVLAIGKETLHTANKINELFSNKTKFLERLKS